MFIVNISKFLNNNIATKYARFFSTTSQLKQVNSKTFRRHRSQNKEIGPFGWFLLIIPASTFALGTWQVQRKKWKEGLIAELKAKTTEDPIPLPHDLSELDKLEYRPVHVRGCFLHDRELYMGPRTLILQGDSSTQSQLMSTSAGKSQGYLVITPFKLFDRNEIILINRGWVPSQKKNPATRLSGQVGEVVDVIGVVRVQENRPNFAMKNSEESNNWFYKDLKQMAKATGALPVLLDATDEFDVPGGPKGGQTIVTLRNEHMSYILTWYSLCAGTSYLWYKQFIQRAVK